MCHKNLCSLFMWGIVIKFMNIHGFSTETSSRENFPFSSIHTYDYRFFFFFEQFWGCLVPFIDWLLNYCAAFSMKSYEAAPKREKENTRIHFILICYLRFFSTKCVYVYMCFKCLYQHTHTRNQYHPHSLHTSKSPAHRLSHAFGLATSGINKNI